MRQRLHCSRSRGNTPASSSSRSEPQAMGRRRAVSRGSPFTLGLPSRPGRKGTPRSHGRQGQQDQQDNPRTPSNFSRGGTPGQTYSPGMPSSALVRSRSAARASPSTVQSVVGDELLRGQPEFEESVVDEIIMAIDMREKATIGCAAFNTGDGTLALCQDIPWATLDVVEQLVVHIQPTTILISCRAPEQLLGFLEARSHGPGEDAGSACYILRALASSDFVNETARDRLLSLQLDDNQHIQAIVTSANEGDLVAEEMDGAGRPREAGHIEALRWGTVINLDSYVSVNAAGAVLADLHRRRSVGFLPDGQAAEVVFHIRTLRMFSLSNHMFVSAETLQSLQIIQSERHPGSQICGPGPSPADPKEGLSVYGLFHLLVCTPQGRDALRLMFMRPSLDVSLILERQRTISLFVRPTNTDFVKHASQLLKRVRNIRSAIANLKRGIDSSSTRQSFYRGVWATLRGFSAYALRLRELASNLADGGGLCIIRKVLDAILPAKLMAIGDAIDRTIDFEQSKDRRRPSVKAGIDPRLDDMRRQYEGMDSFLTNIVNDINQRIPQWAAQYIKSCIFLPQLGFLTVVERDSARRAGKYEGEGSDEGQWQRKIVDSDVVCYKNKFMDELDQQYGDMYSEIGDREVEIIHQLARDVLLSENALGTASDICGEFDAHLALAKGAEKYAWSCPQVMQSATIEITSGRHPLQELVVPSFVPNNCAIGTGRTPFGPHNACSAMVLTGPNHSGKSVYIKQTAIIVYLAHIGSFVPADKAIIGVTDKILTRLSTAESVSRNESAFAIELRQVSTAIKSATPQSLVLIDKFGKGTNADDGAGLLAATLDHFLTAGNSVPRFLLATHFHELFEGGYLVGCPNLGVFHMEVVTDPEAIQPESQITYLFTLKVGHSNSSFGGRCAALNGVPGAVVRRAEAISTLISRNEDLVSACAKLSEQEEVKLQVAEEVARRFLGVDFDSGLQGHDQRGKPKDLLTQILTPDSRGN